MNKWTDKEEDLLKMLYGTKPYKDMVIDLPRHSKLSIRRKSRDLCLNKTLDSDTLISKFGKMYSCDEEFFSIPNLINCAYAGFIATDGCIYDCSSNSKKLNIHINKKDEHYLRQFLKDIKYNGNLYYGKNNDISLNISSVKICNDLLRHWNITPVKSLTLQPPNIKDIELIKAYIIGYIDGDGSIHRMNNEVSIKFCSGSKAPMDWIKKSIDYLIPLKPNRPNANVLMSTKNRINPIYTYTIAGKRGTQLYNTLKNIKVPKLDRKWS